MSCLVCSPFAVDEDFREVVSDEPAWQVRYEMPAVMLSGDGARAMHSYRTSAGRRQVSMVAAQERGDGEETSELSPESTREERAARPSSPSRDVAEDGLEEEEGTGRAQRAVWSSSLGAFGKDMQWHCESPLRWVDLGPDYFPRYLRSADCGHHTCSGDRFVCKPRSFTVKVLRRREGMCAPAGDLPREESSSGLPHDLRDLWIWELRAVNFCCVCSIRM